jgi:hypothetical protein
VVDRQLLAGDQVVHVETERSYVGGQFPGAFLKRQTDAGLIELRGAADQNSIPSESCRSRAATDRE